MVSFPSPTPMCLEDSIQQSEISKQKDDEKNKQQPPRFVNDEVVQPCKRELKQSIGRSKLAFGAPIFKVWDTILISDTIEEWMHSIIIPTLVRIWQNMKD